MARVLVVEVYQPYKRPISIDFLVEGFEVAVANDAREVFLFVESCPDVDLVMIDASTPGLDVDGLVRRLRAAYPELRVAQTGKARVSTSRGHLEGWGAPVLGSKKADRPSAPMLHG